MLIALTRAVSRSLASCELTYVERDEIDIARAEAQHASYCSLLARHGATVLRLPPEHELPDAVFVEDPVLVLDEVAIALQPGAPSRRPEVDSLAAVLEQFRPLERVNLPGTVDGGDIVRMGRHLYVGMSARSNEEGIRQLQRLGRAYGYTVTPVSMQGCLHLKSGCTSVGDRVIINPDWVDTSPFARYSAIAVPAAEPGGADVLRLADVIVAAASFPATAELLQQAGYSVDLIDVSEFQKAEAGVTCLSVVFEGDAVPAGLAHLTVRG